MSAWTHLSGASSPLHLEPAAIGARSHACKTSTICLVMLDAFVHQKNHQLVVMAQHVVIWHDMQTCKVTLRRVATHVQLYGAGRCSPCVHQGSYQETTRKPCLLSMLQTCRCRDCPSTFMECETSKSCYLCMVAG